MESTSPASAGANRSSRREPWDITTTWRWPVPSPSRSSSTIRSTSITRRPTFSHSVDVARADPETPQVGAALATFKRDRFASLETSEWDPGPCRVVTKPFTVRHPKLFLNAATWMKGSIRVEALTRDWQPIPGFTEPQARTVQGDALDHPVRWNDNADLSKLIGKGNPPQVLHDARATPRDDAEQRRQKVGAGRQRISVRPAG